MVLVEHAGCGLHRERGGAEAGADAGQDAGADAGGDPGSEPGPGDEGGHPDGGDGGADAVDGGGDTGCVDTCPFAPGVAYGCQRRFVHGVNWAWKNWCGDFGGISAWGFKGVSSDRQAFSDDMATMKATGVNVIRWWMFPRFLTDSIQWNADDTPSGVGGTLLADVAAALALAEENGVGKAGTGPV